MCTVVTVATVQKHRSDDLTFPANLRPRTFQFDCNVARPARARISTAAEATTA